MIEPQQGDLNSNRELLGATEHPKEYHGYVKWIHQRTVTIMPNKYKRIVPKALEINRLKTLNETMEISMTKQI